VAETGTSPLAGKRVVITRAVAQSSGLFDLLRARGAQPISLPLVSFAPPQDFASVDAALQQLSRFDWIILTSANAVHALAARCATIGYDLRDLKKPPHVAVVGPATKQEAELAGFRVDYVARTHLGVALAEELSDQLHSKRVFLPRSDRANPDLPAAIRRLAANVTEVVAYRTLPPGDLDRERAARVMADETDAVVFFSPSAVHNLTNLLGREQFAAAQNSIVIAAVGPVTAAALRESAIHRLVIAADTTSSAVVAALEAYFGAAPSQPQPSPHQFTARTQRG
jgi:uroporphyrinogen-III synthase